MTTKYPRPNWIADAIRTLPWATAAIASGLCLYIVLHDPTLPVSRTKDVLGAVANLAAVFVGFAATAKTILLALSGSKVIDNLKTQDGYKYVVAHFFDTVALGLVAGSLSMIGLALDWEHCTTVERTFAALVAGVALGMIVSVAQTTYYLRLLLLAT